MCRAHEHARAFMCLRCCPGPLSAPPFTTTLDSTSYAHLRTKACFAPRCAPRCPLERGCVPLFDPPASLPSLSTYACL